MCLGGLRRSLGVTFDKITLKTMMVQKVSGQVQEGHMSPGAPQFVIGLSYDVS